MSACLACNAPALEVGRWPSLCLADAVIAARFVPRSITQDQRLVLRERCWGEALTCPSPSVTVTAHGGWCRAHAPAQPVVHVAVKVDDQASAHGMSPEVLAGVVAVMRGLSGTVLRETRTYGAAS